ncbi:methyltransferase [Reichenbachiella carrageenanivorans]|uniref:Methyltransferase n=1 Tax=Reichenbachiella carrageenanivorans TaxID=2979869 RepID=A0ABY6D310_9BACT|nr:methyltransferase [Reichenbachiella carrageenanivorans]UXX80149.1 methyltransferase [Reichenbachiella carrageenanivorans]
MSNSYHNMTAHYNAYFIAKEHITTIEQTIEDQYDWNYNLILPVFPQFDSVSASAFTPQIEDCIEKASLAIQRHKGSKWEDDSYVLVGKARFYSLDYQNAVETFKYVNTKGKDDNAKHEALVALMRTFIEYNESNNAIAVSDYLKKEKLNRTNLKDLYLTRGYLYQRAGDYNNMVQNLIQAEALITNFKERARINFIIGQVYQTLGFDGEAYLFYKQTLKNNPPYELSFYTKLNMAQVTQLAKTNDAKKVRKYFRKLLKDRKNEEFKDKIYYEMAKFEVRHGHLDQGISYYNSSVRSSVNNNRQKAHSYLSLGKIYYDSLAKYKLAKLYYDSTLSVLPKDELEYAEIEARQKILENFVTQYTIIQVNDSLLNLTKLPPDSLDRFLNAYIAQEEEAEMKRREEEKKRKRNEARLAANSSSSFTQNTGNIGGNNFQGTTWYFYNPSAVSRGRSDFKRLWGDRALEDNWRRSNSAAAIEIDDEGGAGPDGKPLPDDKEGTKDKEEAFKIDKAELIATLPQTEEDKQQLLNEIEEASYQLGNIYNFDLDEKHNSAETFENLFNRFPQSEYRHEVMYLLYIIFNEMDNIPKSDYYKNLLLEEAPESIYAKIIINPNYRAESQAASEKLKKVYAQAYAQYQTGDYKQAMALINDGLREYPDNDFVDNIALLKILVQGKSESIYKYQYELNNFIKTYTESELIPYADSLVKASEQYQINLVNSTRAKFIPRLDKPHFFIFVYETDQQLSDALPQYFKTLIPEESSLKIGNLLLDEKHSIILISEFADKASAIAFNEKVETEKPSEKINKSGKFSNFVITKDNFNILYQTRELDTYLKFYRKNYQQ